MRINKLLYGILIAVFGFSSCYDDKGNYDYKELGVNDITISFKSYTVTPFYGEPAIFVPIIKYANNEVDTTIYKFEYCFEKYGVVCTERNMNYVFQGETGSVSGIVIATDTTTGKKWYQSVSVSYQSPYEKGWIVLSDDGGKSRLNMIRLRNDEYLTDQKLYTTLYGEDLGTQPYRLFLNTKGMSWNENKELRVLQYGPEGSVSLNPKNLEKTKTLASEFASGEEPDGLKPVTMGFSANAAVVVGDKGDMYTRTYNNDKLNYSMFVDIPMKYNNRILDIQYVLTDHPIQTMYNIIIYDRATQRFMTIYAAAYYYAGTPSVLNPPVVLPPNIPTPNKLTGYENLYSQLFNTSYYETGVFALLKNEEGKIFAYSFSYDTGDDVCTALSMSEFTASDKVNENTKFHRLRSRPYLFIATGSALYYYDLNTNIAYPYKTDFSGNITCIESDYINKDSAVGIGLDNGEFYLLDVSEDVFMSGQIPEPIYHTKVAGKVVDCLCK
ncbi:PKD-like family lipoprotein [Butyricimonas sp.]|uniref:PKD-like family lipoprotein n=1 Tax=Butyricimonas sp. TaxID=1969738 RepID=UPI0025B9E76E|nr:PKD-like family lipoprotein [Butyricimonas sp.]